MPDRILTHSSDDEALVDGAMQPDDREPDILSLRPERLDEYVGQAEVVETLKIAIEAARSVERVLSFPKAPVCHIVGFGDSSVDYILRFWIDDPTGGLTNIRGNVYLALWDAFQAAGVSIPFPQREVRMLEAPTRPLDAE